MLTKQKLRAVQRKTKKVLTPGWGEDEFVYVIKLNGTQIERVQELIAKHGKQDDAQSNGHVSDMRLLAELCAVVTCNEDGSPWLEPKDVDDLLEGPWEPVEQCVEAGLAFNNLTDESMDKVRDNLKKNQDGKHG